MSLSGGRKTLQEREAMTDIERLRHSCAHVMATAISRLWPEAQFAAGPPVENGFYYDVEMLHRVTPEDFPKIEAAMQEVVTAAQPFEKEVVSRDEALKLAEQGRLAALSARPAPSKFKLDIIRSIPDGEPISLYKNGDFIDLCAGPHVADTSLIRAFKVTSIASAYYKGDESNPQLQRIYGTAFHDAAAMEAYFLALEEAKKRDHRKLGKELGLFVVDDEVGQGLILWPPAGAILRQELQNFISTELRKQGYQQVFTPHIGKLALYKTSGHFPFYKDSQFPPIIEKESLDKVVSENCSCAEMTNRLEAVSARFAGALNERTGSNMIEQESVMSDDKLLDGYLLKPMNCPHHIKIYASRPHSYRDLPMRLAEFGTVYRWEQSGELNGMTRVRGFTQDDAHIFCTEEQVSGEILGCLALVKKVLSTLGMEEYRVRVGLRDPDSTKYTGDAANWDKAEAACRDAAKTLGVPFTEEPGEAAFYGPKIDFVVRDVIGREWQLGTVQVDYNLPVRFDISYATAENTRRRPVMIHRAPFGSLERFCGVLIEHFAGAFPLWLCPEQVRVLPVIDAQVDKAREYEASLLDRGVRVTVDASREKLGAKIRLAQTEKVFYMLVVGAREASVESVSVRSRKRGDEGVKPFAEWLRLLCEDIAERKN